MRWFKHDCDMHTDLKIQSLMEKHGLEGYGIFNLCLEMVGKEGRGGRINGQLRWRQGICKVAGWSEDGKLDKILETMAELGLICSKSLKYGNLYIPKFIKRADNYTTQKLRRDYEETTKNIPPEKKRIDKIRTEYIRVKGWDINNFTSDDFARTAKAIKNLILKAKGDGGLVEKGLIWASQQNWCDWTLETLIKKWQDFLKTKTQKDYKSQMDKEFDDKLAQWKNEQNE